MFDLAVVNTTVIYTFQNYRALYTRLTTYDIPIGNIHTGNI